MGAALRSCGPGSATGGRRHTQLDLSIHFQAVCFLSFFPQEANAWDCALAPRLYLARAGCRMLKAR